jgi:hypothetical protein
MLTLLPCARCHTPLIQLVLLHAGLLKHKFSSLSSDSNIRPCTNNECPAHMKMSCTQCSSKQTLRMHCSCSECSAQAAVCRKWMQQSTRQNEVAAEVASSLVRLSQPWRLLLPCALWPQLCFTGAANVRKSRLSRRPQHLSKHRCMRRMVNIQSPRYGHGAGLPPVADLQEYDHEQRTHALCMKILQQMFTGNWCFVQNSSQQPQVRHHGEKGTHDLFQRW